MSKHSEAKREEAAQLMALGVYDHQKIADKIGVCRKTLWTWRQDPEFQARIRELNQVTFLESSSRAIKRLTEVMESKNDAAAVAACKEILRLAGYDAPIKIQADVEQKAINVNINIEDET